MGLELGGCARFKKSEFGLLCCLGASGTALRPTPPSKYYDHPCPDPDAVYLGVYREPELEAYISMGPSLANFSLYLSIGYSSYYRLYLEKSKSFDFYYQTDINRVNLITYAIGLKYALNLYFWDTYIVFDIGYHNRRGLLFGLGIGFKIGGSKRSRSKSRSRSSSSDGGADLLRAIFGFFGRKELNY